MFAVHVTNLSGDDTGTVPDDVNTTRSTCRWAVSKLAGICELYADVVNPLRTCIGCRVRDEQSALIRFVRRGDQVVEATTPRAEGRGAYLHEGCFDLAVKRHAIRRAFGSNAELAWNPRGTI